jgi:hypothetical protein
MMRLTIEKRFNNKKPKVEFSNLHNEMMIK